jgi:oxalate decarboxylase/phosphoglucose isomerase-like protein (cupin superfamily)
MQAQSFFGGRATVKSLLVTDQPANRSETCARIQSQRGEMAVLTDGYTPIRHLAYIELRPGMLRGNHFHKLRHEYCYLIAGELTLTLSDISSGEKALIPMRAGDLAYISPGIAHVLHPTSPGQALEYAAEPFDLSDVFPHQIA